MIQNFIDTRRIEPQAKDNGFSRTYGLSDSFVIMYAGNIGIPHGVEVLVHTAHILRGQRDILFCFVARGEYKDQIQALAAEKKLDNVLFIEPQPERYVPQIWASASVGAITYRRQLADFSVPSKLLACMCAQRPVLAAADDNSATSKLIAKAGCGVVVPPESPQTLAETIVWMKEHPLDLQEMAANGRRYAKKHLRKEAIVDRYESLFQEVASS